MIDESPPGRGNRGGFSGGVSGTSCNQASGVVTEFQVINSIVIISIVECRDESPPGRGNRGGFSCASWYQGARIPGLQVSLLKFQVIISIVMICIVE